MYFIFYIYTKRKAGNDAISMGTWEAYLAPIDKHVPESEDEYVFDPFRLIAYIIKAVDPVRKDEYREPRSEGQELFIGTKYLWLYSGENLPFYFDCGGLVLRQFTIKTI